MDGYQCGGFEFFSNFDSANIAKVEQVPLHESSKCCFGFLYSVCVHSMIIFSASHCS